MRSRVQRSKWTVVHIKTVLRCHSVVLVSQLLHDPQNTVGSDRSAGLHGRLPSAARLDSWRMMCRRAGYRRHA